MTSLFPFFISHKTCPPKTSGNVFISVPLFRLSHSGVPYTAKFFISGSSLHASIFSRISFTLMPCSNSSIRLCPIQEPSASTFQCPSTLPSTLYFLTRSPPQISSCITRCVTTTGLSNFTLYRRPFPDTRFSGFPYFS